MYFMCMDICLHFCVYTAGLVPEARRRCLPLGTEVTAALLVLGN